MEDGLEGNSDLAAMIQKEEDNDDPDYIQLIPESNQADDMDNQGESEIVTTIMKSEIPADMWQLECERVGHKLKLPNIQDTKEWRNHLE